MKKLAVFDIEVLENVFICVVKANNETRIFEVSARINQLKEMCEFFTSGKYIFVGYNCAHYDTIIMNMLITHEHELLKQHNHLLVTKNAKKLSDWIINDLRDKYKLYKYKNYFQQIDLMTMMASKALRVGLKSLQVTLCYPNVKEMVIDWNEWLHIEKIESLVSYCINDVDSTYELLKLLKDDLQLRIDIHKSFNLECLSKDGVGIGVSLFTNYMLEDLGLTTAEDLMRMRNDVGPFDVIDYLLPEICFETEPFKKLHDYYKSLKLDSAGLSLEFDSKGKRMPAGMTVLSKGLAHTGGLGGIHSVNKPSVYEKGIKNGKEMIIIDIDVTGMYPSMAISHNFGPSGFKEAFLKRLKAIKDERVIAKKNGEKVKDKVFKLLLNSLLGNLRNEYSPYYAPEANTAICINGQLLICMLIERLEAEGVEMILSNTDGICVYLPKDKEERLYEICKEWEKIAKLDLEYVYYDKIVMFAVNDYLAIKSPSSYDKFTLADADFPKPEEYMEYNYAIVKNTYKGNNINDLIKSKGLFIPYPRISKGLESLIIAKALINYFAKNIPVENTITDFKSFNDYMIFQKVNRDFTVEYDGEKQQHINRYIVSHSNKPPIMKCKIENGIKKYTHLLKGHGVVLANNIEDVSIEDINFGYYIKEAQKLISIIENRQLTLF